VIDSRRMRWARRRHTWGEITNTNKILVEEPRREKEFYLLGYNNV
jgi:hypothetical protein